MTLESCERSDKTVNVLVECPYCGESLINDDGNKKRIRNHLPCNGVEQ